MELQKLEGDFCICKLSSIEQIDFTKELLFVAKTTNEISLVCESADIPAQAIEIEGGWKALRILGILDFGLIGVIAKISNILADAGVGIFVISTYNTDYILLKTENFDKGLNALMSNGYIIKESK